MRIHQFVHTLHYGDAISGEALAIMRMLREAGIESEIYAVNVHEKLKGSARKFERFGAELAQGSGPAAVLLHYSIASPLNELFVQCPGVAKGLIYHNITPAEWFVSYNARVAADIRKAREGIPAVVAAADFIVADSQYNIDDLRSSKPAHVLPLLLDEEKWSISSNSGIAAALRDHGGRNIIHVGRTAPNKRLEDIIKIFYFYHHKLDKKSRLWLVGSDIDTEIYSFELKRLLIELHLEEAVTLVGSVADSELKAFYENADAYLCMSEHEGFCVPLIEAMYFGVPIIAYDSCAVGETLADAGILVAVKAHAEIAILLERVVTDAALCSALKEAGKKRVQDFAPAAFRKNLQRFVIEQAGRP